MPRVAGGAGWPPFPGRSWAGAAMAGDARPCATPGPAGRRLEDRGGLVRSAFPCRPYALLRSGPKAPRAHSWTRGVGDRKVSPVAGSRPRFRGPPASWATPVLHPQPRVALLPLRELGPPACPPLPLHWGERGGSFFPPQMEWKQPGVKGHSLMALFGVTPSVQPNKPGQSTPLSSSWDDGVWVTPHPST